MQPEKTSEKRKWNLLQVETAIACNLKCIMCPWKDFRETAHNKGLMTPEIWKSVSPYLENFNSVDFTGGGEPLLQPMLTDWIRSANTAGCNTGVLTNGIFLEKKKSKELIEAGLDWLCVSVDGGTTETYEKIRIGGRFKSVCKNISDFSSARTGKKPKLMINFVIMSRNVHELENIVKLASSLGVDQINFKQCDVIRQAHGKNLGLFSPVETRDIKRLNKRLNRAKKKARKLGIQTTAFSFTPDEKPVCDQDPRSSFFIRHDGAVSACINLAIGGQTVFLGENVKMPSVHYGRLPEDNLFDLYQSDICKNYRHCFEERVQAYEKTLLNELFKSAGSGRERTFQKAKNAMPPAPAGCRVCHYLYNI